MSNERWANELLDLPERFEVRGLVGEGAQRRVHYAIDREKERDVAVSVIPIPALGRGAIERLHGIRSESLLTPHPNVVSSYEVVEGTDHLYLIAEYVSGGDLAGALASGNVVPSARSALRIGGQIARALEHAHACGIVHGDVKPANVLLRNGADTVQAVLGDFGFASLVDAPLDHRAAVTGTPAYIAPERISGAGAGAASDLYSLGCTLYELATGRPPFVSDSAVDLLGMHQATRPTPPIDRCAVSPALNDLVLKLIEKRPEDRPARAADVRSALDGILASESAYGLAASDHGPRTVGRRAQALRFDRRIEQARAGSPSVTIVTGERGIGKSRFLRDAARAAEGAGFLVLFASDDVGPTGGGLIEALRALSGRLGEMPAAQQRLMRRVLERDAEPLALGLLSERGVTERRLFATALSGLLRFSQSRPILVVADDLCEADSSSSGLFEYLARELPRVSRAEIALLGAYKTGEGRDLAEATAGDALRDWIHLEPLDEDDAIALVAGLAPAQPGPSTRERMLELAQGNPLFLEQMARWVGRAAPEASQRAPVDLIGLPPDASQLIRDRLQRTTRACAEVIELAAVAGPRFHPALIVELHDGPASEVADALAEAVDELLLVPRPDGTFGFGHALIHGLVYESLDGNVRRDHHARVFECLRRRSLPFAVRAQDEAHHLLRAGPAGPWAGAVRVVERASEEALSMYGWREAIDMLERLLALDEAQPSLSLLEAARAHRLLAHARFGLLEGRTGCVEHFEAAAARYHESGDAVAHAETLAGLARARIWFGDVDWIRDGGVDPLETALERLGAPEARLRAQLLDTLAEAFWAQRDFERAGPLARAALDVARSVEADDLIAEVSITLGLIQYQGLELEAAISTWQTGRDAGDRADDVSASARCLQRSLMATFARGRFDQTRAIADELDGLHRILQMPGEISIRHAMRVSVAAAQGDLAAADRIAEQTAAGVRRSNYPWSIALFDFALAAVRALHGRVGEAVDALASLANDTAAHPSAAFFTRSVPSLSSLATLYAGNRSPEAANEVEALRRSMEAGGGGEDHLLSACTLVELSDAAAIPADLAPAARTIDRAAGHGFRFSHGWPFFVPRIHALQAMLAGDFDAADTRFERADRTAQRFVPGIELGRVRLDRARLLARRGRPEDRERAGELAAAAAELLADVPQSLFHRRALQLRGHLRGE